MIHCVGLMIKSLFAWVLQMKCLSFAPSSIGRITLLRRSHSTGSSFFSSHSLRSAFIL